MANPAVRFLYIRKNNSILIRRAEISDLPQLAKLFDDYRVFYKKETALMAAGEFLKERMLLSESILFVAEENDQLTGFTQLYPLFSSTRMCRIWLLNDLFVLPEHRGRGLSKELIEAAKEHSRKTGAAGLLLETEKSNSIGNTLYPSVGFVLNNETNFYWWENKG